MPGGNPRVARRRPRLLPLLQGIVTVLVAGTAAGGLLPAGRAGDAYGTSVDDEIARSAGMVEDLRYLYVDEAPTAYRIATARVRAEAYRRAADRAGADGGVAAVEAVVQREAAFRLEQGER